MNYIYWSPLGCTESSAKRLKEGKQFTQPSGHIWKRLRIQLESEANVNRDLQARNLTPYFDQAEFADPALSEHLNSVCKRYACLYAFNWDARYTQCTRLGVAHRRRRLHACLTLTTCYIREFSKRNVPVLVLYRTADYVGINLKDLMIHGSPSRMIYASDAQGPLLSCRMFWNGTDLDVYSAGRRQQSEMEQC
jgi:hypothetical protein